MNNTNKFSDEAYNWVDKVTDYVPTISRSSEDIKEGKRKLIIGALILIVTIIIGVIVITEPTYNLARKTYKDKVVYYEVTPYEYEVIDVKYTTYLRQNYISIKLSDGEWYKIHDYTTLDNIKAIVYKAADGKYCDIKIVSKDKISNTEKMWYSYYEGLVEPFEINYSGVRVLNTREECSLYNKYKLNFRDTILLIIIAIQIVVILIIIHTILDIIYEDRTIKQRKHDIDKSSDDPCIFNPDSLDLTFKDCPYTVINKFETFLNCGCINVKRLDYCQGYIENREENIILYIYLSKLRMFGCGISYRMVYEALTNQEFKNQLDKVVLENKRKITEISSGLQKEV